MKKHLILTIIFSIILIGFAFGNKGFDAGYERAELKGIDWINQCEGNSEDFIEGCKKYAGQKEFEAGYDYAGYPGWENGIYDKDICQKGNTSDSFIEGCQKRASEIIDSENKDFARTIKTGLIVILWSLFSFRLFPILIEKLFNIDKEIIMEKGIHTIVWFSPIGVLIIYKLLSYIISGGSLLLSILIIIILLRVIIRKFCK